LPLSWLGRRDDSSNATRAGSSGGTTDVSAPRQCCDGIAGASSRALRAFHEQCSSPTSAGAALCANGRHPTSAMGPTCNEGASGGAAQSASTPILYFVCFVLACTRGAVQPREELSDFEGSWPFAPKNVSASVACPSLPSNLATIGATRTHAIPRCTPMFFVFLS